MFFFGIFFIFAENSNIMKNYRIYYKMNVNKKTFVNVVSALSVKAALTQFNAMRIDCEVLCIQNVDFDSSLFNF